MNWRGTLFYKEMDLFKELFSVLCRIKTCMFLYITAEIRGGREIHAGGYFRQGQFLLAQQVRNLMQGEAVYPVSRRFAARLLAYLGEIVGRDAKAGGVVGNIPVPNVFAVVEQSDELLQQPGGMFGHLPGCLPACMDVVQVEDMRH